MGKCKRSLPFSKLATRSVWGGFMRDERAESARCPSGSAFRALQPGPGLIEARFGRDSCKCLLGKSLAPRGTRRGSSEEILTRERLSAACIVACKVVGACADSGG